jgi:redox-sensitive bicupin YhaK (pirin superfamily)
VRPHPHIGLATVTYLLEGEILHRDSVGSVQAIRPGEVNWMTAGSGIVHSERTGREQRAAGGRLFGLQTWVALPTAHEEAAPAFSHHKAHDIPAAEAEGIGIRLIAGTLDGMRSPVPTFSDVNHRNGGSFDVVYADISLAAGARYQVRAEHIERAIYVVSGSVAVEGQSGSFGKDELVIFQPGAEIILRAEGGPARLMLIGGEPYPEKRYIEWNFVHSNPERIAQAKQDWREHRFPSVPYEHEFIPLPADPEPVRYP